jgi:hypothetical protein
MSEDLTAIELLETACYLLPEPNIVIEIVLHELLHVFVGTARDIGGNAVELGLQFRAKVHVHDLRVAPRPIYWLRNEDSNF